MTCNDCNECRFADKKPDPDVFEIHLTVTDEFQDVNYGRALKSLSDEQHWKVLIVVIPDDQPRQPMVTISHRGDSASALELTWRSAQLLERSGFPVTRRKIEASPTSPMTPTSYNGRRFGETYLEHHLKLDVGSSFRLSALRRLCKPLGFRVSSNAFTHGVYFATTRSQRYLDHAAVHWDWSASVVGRDYPVLKRITEYCILDDNHKMDEGWR